MAAVGGAPKFVSLGGRIFATTSDGDSTRQIGGVTNEFKANGDGATGRAIKTRRGWKVAIVIEVDDSREDEEYLKDLNDATETFACVFTYASDISYQGDGYLTGDVEVNVNDATVAITLEGPGTLTQQ